MNQFAIETCGLTKQYGTQFSVNQVSLHVPYGKIYGLMGRNGAGKTTTMRMLLNLVRPTSGKIFLFGKEYQSHPQKIYQKIGSIIEYPGFYENLTGYENLKILTLLRGKHRKDSISHTLKLVGLEQESNKVFADYSLGMKQRLGIAAAIMHEPELLILDEPINGLDPIGIHEIRDFLLTLCREKGTTIFISSHVLSEIEQIADIVGVMHKGKLIEEADMAELHKQNRKYVAFTVSDVNTAARLLEQFYPMVEFLVLNDSTIRLFDFMERRGDINRCFMEHGLNVTDIYVNEERLEDYFSRKIGGDEHAFTTTM